MQRMIWSLSLIVMVVLFLPAKGTCQTLPQDLIIHDGLTSTGSFFYNVRDFGATGNGSDDDSQAIQEALTRAGESGHGVVYIPEGVYLLKQPVTWARLSGPRTLSGLSIKGDGIGKTIVIVDNETGGFLLDDFYSLTQFQVRDITVLAAMPGVGTALTVGKYGNRTGVRGYRCFYGENIEIKGQSPADYFKTGVSVIAIYRPLYRNISFTGATDPGNEYLAGTGLVTDGCYSPDVIDCKVKNADRGFSYIPPGDDKEGPEAGTFHNCAVDNCIIGIDVDQPINEPELVINYCYLKTRDIGIRISRKKFYQVRNNIFEPVLDPEIHEYRDISTLGSFMAVYHRNIFKKYAAGNSNEKMRTCVSFDESGWVHDNNHMIVTDNIFPGTGTDIGGEELEQMASRVLKDNQYATSIESGKIKKLMRENYFLPLYPDEPGIIGQIFSVMDYGAQGNDWSDDADAFQAAVDALILNGGGILYVPAGKFLIDKPIEIDIPESVDIGTIAIRGEGPAVSVVICNNSDAGFRLTDNSGKVAVDIQNFGIYANQNGATAIKLESKGEKLPDYRTLKVRNIDVQPYDDTFSQHIHFKNGLIADGFSKPLFDNFIFNSYVDPKYDMPVNDMTDYGVYLKNCNNVSFIFCYVWKTKYAYYINSEICNNSYFYRTRGVGGFHGIYMDIKKPSSGLWVESCHVNKTMSNIYISNISDFVIIDNLPYGPANENKLNDIELVNCRNGHIIGNVYQSPGLDNLQLLPVSNRNTILIRGNNSGNILIEKNIYNAKGRALVMEEGIEGVVVRDNLYPNTRVDQTVGIIKY